MNDIYVNKVFSTIQGEGVYAGMPAMFLRLQGCQVNCPFCDTKYSWQQDGQTKTTVDSTVALIWQLTNQCGHPPLLVITGGEPLEQIEPLEELLHRVKGIFPRIQIETSGYVPMGEHKLHKLAEISLSPKCRMAPILEWYSVAESIKFLVGHEGLESPVDIEWVLGTFPQLNSENVFLQPIDYDHLGYSSKTYEAQEQAKELAMRYGVRISLQIHKILDVA